MLLGGILTSEVLITKGPMILIDDHFSSRYFIILFFIFCHHSFYERSEKQGKIVNVLISYNFIKNIIMIIWTFVSLYKNLEN